MPQATQAPGGVSTPAPKQLFLPFAVAIRGLGGTPPFREGWRAVSLRTKCLLNKREKYSVQSKTLQLLIKLNLGAECKN